MSSIATQVSYLRTSREFPEDLKKLTVEINKAYIDTAVAVNDRTIGLYTVRKPTVTGEGWFITSKKQQTLRQIYPFTSTASIPHGIVFTDVTNITQMRGTYFNTALNQYFGLIPASSTAIAGQVTFYLTSTNIVFVLGAGAPAVNSGIIILEWLSES